VKNISLSEISFDEQDANIFQVDDLRLRADALKHSVLPRLRVVLNEAIHSIHKCYGIDVFEDSIISVYPNFRTKRENELKIPYGDTFAGLGGQRKDKWPGFAKKNGKRVQILPFRFAFTLSQEGVGIILENGWLKGLTDDSFRKILGIYLDHEKDINALCFSTRMHPDLIRVPNFPFPAPLSEQYRYRQDKKIFNNHFFSHLYHFPVSETQIWELIGSYIEFFPVYDSYIQAAKGNPSRLVQLIKNIDDYFLSIKNNDPDRDNEEVDKIDLENIKAAAIAAEKKVKVMPSIRWQVFQRDQWKCVSCGRSAHDDVILHVDHIIPRSKGGQDTLENYQTLCSVCNIGKSNRDTTDLRR